MSGIDKLLHSQELTLAFVGVAPALVIVYLAGGWLRKALFGGREKFGSQRDKLNVVTNIR
jgi:nuclear control of ATPase protein 2